MILTSSDGEAPAHLEQSPEIRMRTIQAIMHKKSKEQTERIIEHKTTLVDFDLKADKLD